MMYNVQDIYRHGNAALWELYAYAPPSRQPADGTANGACGPSKGTCLRRQVSAQARQRSEAEHTLKSRRAGQLRTKASVISKHKS
jgi:hypothetical protein